MEVRNTAIEALEKQLPTGKNEKIRLIKVVTPEIVAYFSDTKRAVEPDYRCAECGGGVDTTYVCCPYCRADLDWDAVRKPCDKFLKILEKL